MTSEIAIGSRVRKSPFYEATISHGVKQFSIYNHMYMPTSYGNPAAEYEALTEKVSIWDVSCQRQVEIVGPDALELLEYLSSRGMRSCKVGRSRYTPICDHQGILINDPITLRLSDDRYWVSIADGDLLLWTQAVSAERSFNCSVFEPEVSPLAVQGPNADQTMADLLGDWVMDIPFFGFVDTELDDIPFLICRSGWSGQGGFELFLTDSSKGVDLWERVWDSGLSYGINPGTPNAVERIESGLLSYRTDCGASATPLELGLERFMNLEREDNFIGKEALLMEKDRGPSRRLVKILLSGERLASPTEEPWLAFDESENNIGEVRVAAWSPAMGENLGLALISSNNAGSDFNAVSKDGQNYRATHLSYFGER
jgi:aminomethyltransferase